MSKRANDLTTGPEDTSLAALVNPRKTRTDVAPAAPILSQPHPPSAPPPATRRPLPQVTEIREEEDWGEDGEDGDDEGFEEYGEEQSVDDDMIHNAERIKSDKMDVLNKLYRLGQKGVEVPAHLSMKSSLEELTTEFGKLEHDHKVRNSIKLQRRMLMGMVTGLEYLNGQADTGVELDGWSSTILSNIDEYDGVFEALYEKYGKRMAVSPELQLVFMVGTSAAMYHLTSSMVKHTLEQAGGGGAAAAASAADPAAMAEYVRNVDRQYRDQETRTTQRAEERQAEAVQTAQRAAARPANPATTAAIVRAPTQGGSRWQPPPLTTVPPREDPPVTGILARVAPVQMESGIEAGVPRPNIVPVVPEFEELPADDTESLGSQPDKGGRKKRGGKKPPAVNL